MNTRTAAAAPAMLVLFLALAFALAFALAACGGPEGSPEALIKTLIADAEQAAEERDVAGLGDAVSDDYQDNRGYDRRTVLRIAQGLFLRNRQIHLLSVVRNLQVEDTSARARVLVAMAGRPIESVDALVNVRADLMRFDIELALEDGEWRVRAADWQRARVDDFL